jgi:DNA polymerase-1
VNRLVLIDGNAILHRAFHALPPLTAPDGSVVNAVYGFTSMLLRIIHDLAPTHIAVAFDRAAPTFRKKLFAEYQAKRPKMDETLIPQIAKVHEVVQVFGIPIFEKDGFEADDIIGTVTRYELRGAKKKNIDQIIIVTGDRDILQLVEDEKVLVYMPTKGLSEGKLYGEKETEERLGVSPKLIPDYKALAGDASDNYPGIAGIGPKTAVEILKKAGSIDELYMHIEKKSFGLSDSLVAKIIKGKQDALLSHELATIKKDVVIDIAIPEFSKAQLTQKHVVEVLQHYGFQSLIKRLGKGEKEVTRQTTDVGKKEKNAEQLELV